MNIPAFSIFSAVSELFVTAIVLYTLVTNLRGGKFRWKLLGVALLFEVCVNVMYMINRAAVADTDERIHGTMAALFAIHGILSLVMLIAILLVYMACTFYHKSGHPTWVQTHPVTSWTLIGLWIIAVGSGEAAFVWRYFLMAA